jgi:hypothetical protein
METTNETVVPEHYNPHQVVTYKVIDLDAPEQTISYPTVKVTDLEMQMEELRKNESFYRRVVDNNAKLHRQLEGELEGWLENDTSAEDIVSEICQIFGFAPEKEIEFEATATITGRVRVPLSEVADFDLDSMDLTVYADSHSHDVDVDVEIDQISPVY